MTARKPRHLKLISGTDQPCRRTEPPPTELSVLDGIPQPPDWLPNSHAVKIWKHYAPICIRIGTLTEGTLESFGHLCAVGGRLRHLWSANETPPTTMTLLFRALKADFGLSSLAIAKPKAKGETKKGRFDRFKPPES